MPQGEINYIYKRTSPSDGLTHLTQFLEPQPYTFLSRYNLTPYFVWDNLSTESKACIDSVMIKIIDVKNISFFT